MTTEIEALKARAASIDAKGDKILEVLADVRARLKAIADNSTELAAMKVAVNDVSESLQSQLDQFDAALVEEPPVEPA